MYEDFVSFETAVKFKKKGLNIPFYFFYRTDDKCIHHAPVTNPLEYSDKIDDEVVIAPTISQVLKWLRDEKAISVEPCATPYNCWFYMIKCKGEIKVTYTGNKYKTYEAAAIAGIEYVPHYLM